MELNQVSYFINLAETLNFTAAARLSGVSQPSLALTHFCCWRCSVCADEASFKQIELCAAIHLTFDQL
ncbi:LysR family transcriptional regulator [Novosphingobium sp. NBM11]|uniref:LysR family transcriptional regulator n=1 Tax=Novosphingobium sp. NBM11 TaxID=2596914 RepID=UPI0035C9364A